MRDREHDDERITTRAATAEDLRQFYEGRPHPTLRARVVMRGNEVLGVIGVAREGAWAKFFSEFKPDLRPHLRRMASLRTIADAMRIVRASHLPVYSLAQADEPDSHRVLQRLGFTHLDGDVYQWPS